MTVALWRNAKLATLDGASGWGLIEDGAIVTDRDTIRWVGHSERAPARRGSR